MEACLGRGLGGVWRRDAQHRAIDSGTGAEADGEGLWAGPTLPQTRDGPLECTPGGDDDAAAVEAGTSGAGASEPITASALPSAELATTVGALAEPLAGAGGAGSLSEQEAKERTATHEARASMKPRPVHFRATCRG